MMEAPLSRYDDLAAREVKDLLRTSEALSKELEAVTEDVDRLQEQLEHGEGKGRLEALLAEHSQLKGEIHKLQSELPRIKQDCDAFHFDMDPLLIEDELNRTSADIGELNTKQERMSRELPDMERDTAGFARSITESEVRLRKDESALHAMEAQATILAAKIAGLERLEDTLKKDKARPAESSYAVEASQLTHNNRPFLDSARDLVGRLDQEFGYLGEEVKESLHLLVLKLSLMQDMEEKGDHAVSLHNEVDTLLSAATDKSSALEELKALNSEDKKKAVLLEDEIAQYRKTLAVYAEEEARGNEARGKKEEASAEFITLFVQKAELQQKVFAAGKIIHELKKLAEQSA